MILNTEIIIKPKSNLAIGLKELWKYRELLFYFSWRDIKVRYKQTTLGLLWTIIQPTLMMAIFIVLLNKGLGFRTGDMPSSLYYLSGLLVWNLFNQSVTNATTSMINNAHIIKKIYFPRMIIPISSVVTASFDYLISIFFYLLIIGYFIVFQESKISIYLVLIGLLISYLITIFTSLGIAFWLSALNIKYRDIRYAIPYFIQILFFITPILYDESIIKSNTLINILQYNPLFYAIKNTRSALISQSDPADLFFFPFTLFLAIIIIFYFGLYFFKKTESQFADII